MIKNENDFKKEFAEIHDMKISEVLIITGAGFDIELYESSPSWSRLLSEIGKKDEKIIQDLLSKGVNPTILMESMDRGARDEKISEILKNRKIKNKHIDNQKYIKRSGVEILTMNYENINRSNESRLLIELDVNNNVAILNNFINMHGDIWADDKKLILSIDDYMSNYMSNFKEISKKLNHLVYSRGIKYIFYLGISYSDVFFHSLMTTLTNVKKINLSFDYNSYIEQYEYMKTYSEKKLSVKLTRYSKDYTNAVELIVWILRLLNKEARLEINREELEKKIKYNDISQSFSELSSVYLISMKNFVEAIDIKKIKKINMTSENFLTSLIVRKAINNEIYTNEIISNLVNNENSYYFLEKDKAIKIVKDYNHIKGIYKILLKTNNIITIPSELLTKKFFEYVINNYEFMNRKKYNFEIKSKEEYQKVFKNFIDSTKYLTTILLNLKNSHYSSAGYVLKLLKENNSLILSDHMKIAKELFDSNDEKLPEWWAWMIIGREIKDIKINDYVKEINSMEQMKFFDYVFEDIQFHDDFRKIKNNLKIDDLKYNSLNYFLINDDKQGFLKLLCDNKKKYNYEINPEISNWSLQKIAEKRNKIYLTNDIFHKSRTLGDGKFSKNNLSLNYLINDSWNFASAWKSFSENKDINSLGQDSLDYLRQLNENGLNFVSDEITKKDKIKYQLHEIWVEKFKEFFNIENSKALLSELKKFVNSSQSDLLTPEFQDDTIFVSGVSEKVFDIIHKMKLNDEELEEILELIHNSELKTIYKIRFLHVYSEDIKKLKHVINLIFVDNENGWWLLSEALRYNNIHNFQALTNKDLKTFLNEVSLLNEWKNSSNKRVTVHNIFIKIYFIIRKIGFDESFEYISKINNEFLNSFILADDIMGIYMEKHTSDLKFELSTLLRKGTIISLESMKNIISNENNDLNIFDVADVMERDEYISLNEDTNLASKIAIIFSDEKQAISYLVEKHPDVNFLKQI
ncbi:MAG: hypothetical protein HRT99_02230 [Mycoplasmatales bacterium]|nr:hypothetical protein [Mycoplasmatales bacterium]